MADSIAIDNKYAQNLSYVQRVTISVASNTTTGLKIESNGQNSGPYSDIAFAGSGTSNPSYTGAACVWVGAPGIKIQGLSCAGTLGFTVAVAMDSYNDSVEDVYVNDEYVYGVVVFPDASVYNDILLNISGGASDTVLICGPSSSSAVCGSTTNTVHDLSLIGISKGGTATNSVYDQVTSTTLPDANLAIYALGQGVPVNTSVTGYARFTTSINTATWGVGSSAPSGNCTLTPANTKGSLFSYTAGTGGSGCTTTCAFWVCNGTSWKGVH